MNPADPDDEYAADDALALAEGRKGDRLARALDLLGWMIVPQPCCDDGQRWPGACPSWAEPPSKPKPPALRLIEGGRDDAAPHI